TISDGEASALLINLPLWIIIRKNNQPVALLLAADLSNYLSATASKFPKGSSEDDLIELLKIPGKRENIAPINQQATLQEALDSMNEKNIDALYISVQNTNIKDNLIVVGVVTRQTIEAQYNNKT
ncbi:MAG: CBS domain-containing protein, partial [Gammaproteobacteria bacterium]|nr:CBS domain-containing protein [Gammaproteobacteria bacterium]